jgi:predicted esterase
VNNRQQDPHGGRPVAWGGSPLSDARLAVILVHGRGGSARDILALGAEFDLTDVAYVAPEAEGHTWYPHSFLAPMERNEPGLSSGLRLLSSLLDDLERGGMPSHRVALVGFSQGACLALEFAARHAHRFAAIAGLSGGLIGPPGTPREYRGSFAGTPVFLGCSDVDPHVPLDRVLESADVLERMGASVDRRIYPGMGHTVTADEVRAVQALLGRERPPGNAVP